LIQALLDAGADVNATATGGRTALQDAAARGYIKIVLMLLNANVDANAPKAGGEGLTAL
jgi:ankyrin repeat protein